MFYYLNYLFICFQIIQIYNLIILNQNTLKSKKILHRLFLTQKMLVKCIIVLVDR